MKILQITSTFVPSKFGGMQAVAYSLSKDLVRRGHEVTVFTTDADVGRKRLKDVHSLSKAYKFRVKYFKNISNLLAFKLRLFLPIGMLTVPEEEIRTFDVIHIHDFRAFTSIVAHRYAKKYNIPYILQAHGSLMTFFQRKQLKKAFDKVWGYRLLRDASKVIALTELEAKQYQEMGVNKDKITIVPNGIDLTEFKNLPKRGEFRRKHGLDSDTKIILYMGRIHKIKGLDLLAEAFPIIHHYSSNTRLVFVGADDGFLDPLTKLIADLVISDKVLFIGFLSNREKVKAYVDADVFVLPSYYEVFSVSLLEACACGVPVVITDRCGIAQEINRRAGFVVPCNKQALATAILNVLCSDEARQLFSEGGKTLANEKFNYGKIVEQVENLYTSEVKCGKEE